MRDLILSHPSLGSSLQQMLDHPGDDVEEVFMCDYAVSTTGRLYLTPVRLCDYGSVKGRKIFI